MLFLNLDMVNLNGVMVLENQSKCLFDLQINAIKAEYKGMVEEMKKV